MTVSLLDEVTGMDKAKKGYTNFMASQSVVFVGNIPYDATEEKLKEICEDIGPVVSFRLVIDRETGKPKGYGFCEYKDKETALSARRNLQGYEINGRQLRVDFAENDKNTDRNREQARGGPGMASNALGDATLHQPIGISVAMAAATNMAQALGAAQTGGMPNHISIHCQTLGSDPLTLHLAKMSRNQLNEIISEIKTIASEDKERARQLFLVNPQLSKAVFQAQIMLGIVPQQMLRVPKQDSVQGQQSIAQNLPPAHPQNKAQYVPLPQTQQVHSSSLLPNQQANKLPQIQLPHLVQNKALHHGQQSLQSGNLTLPVRPQSQGNFSFRPHLQESTSSSSDHQVQTCVLQHPMQATASTNLCFIPPQYAPTIIPDPILQFSAEMESALLQQVMNLAPQQLSVLPPDQQQQVMQLQQRVRQST